MMECFYRSKPFDEEGKPVRGYRQRMFREWRDRGLFESTEQRVCDQARAIRIRSNGVPNADECKNVLGQYLGVKKEHNREAEWLKDLKRERERVNERPQERVSISVEKIRKHAERYQIGKPQGETVSKDIGSRTSAIYMNVFPHK